MKKAFIALLMGVTIISCSKDDDDDSSSGSSLTNTQKISRTWKATSMTGEVMYNNQSYYSEDLFVYFDDCDKDDLIIVASDGTYQETEGATKCDPNDPDVIGSGTWAFINNDSKIVLSDGLFSDTMDLVSPSATTMVVSQEDYWDGDSTYVFTATYSAQ